MVVVVGVGNRKLLALLIKEVEFIGKGLEMWTRRVFRFLFLVIGWCRLLRENIGERVCVD